jgi:hypothetical protein
MCCGEYIAPVPGRVLDTHAVPRLVLYKKTVNVDAHLEYVGLDVWKEGKMSTARILASNVSVSPLTTGAPVDGLGRAFLSTLQKPQGLLVLPSAFESQEDGESKFGLSLVDDRSSYSREVALSAQAKFGYAGGSASLRIEMAEQYHTSARSLVVILTKSLLTSQQFLRDPEWRIEAVQTYLHNPIDFFLRYGDLFVRKVHIGGLCSILYKLDFSSIEDIPDFKANFNASYGNSSGGADLHQRIVKIATHTSISVQGICSGVRQTPALFYEAQGPDQQSRVVTAQDKLADQLIAYFDGFDTRVREDGVAASIYFETDDVFECAGTPTNKVSLADFDRSLEDAADDLIYERIAQLDYISNYAFRWNPSATKEVVGNLRNSLTQLSGKLDTDVFEIATLKRKSPELSFKQQDIPTLPDNWVARKLRPDEGATIQVAPAINNVGRGQYLHEYPVPVIQSGMPVGVDFSMHFETADGNNGVGVELIVDVRLVGGNQTQIIYSDHIYGGTSFTPPTKGGYALYSTDLKVVVNARTVNGKLGFYLKFLS